MSNIFLNSTEFLVSMTSCAPYFSSKGEGNTTTVKFLPSPESLHGCYLCNIEDYINMTDGILVSGEVGC